MLATSYHNVNMPKRQTSFNPEWTKELEFISKRSRDAFHGFCTLCRCEVYLCIYFISRNFMFSGTVSDYLFIYVFILFPEVQKCYIFRHCALQVHLSGQFLKQYNNTLINWINTNTVNKHFFASYVTYRSTSRYIVDHIVWQWIE